MNRLREWMIRKLGGCLGIDELEILKAPRYIPILMKPVTMATTVTATRLI